MRLPGDAAGVYVLARVAWDAGRRDEALELYRFASCLDDKDEGLARAYFAAARCLRREDEPLRLLSARFRRLGSLSSWPARTLHGALAGLDRADEAAAVLDEALRLRPDDGDLRLFAAEADAHVGETARAAERLESARGVCRRGDWLRTAAGLASTRGELAEALGFWREVLEAEPTALDANRAAARLLAETEGRPSAIGHLTRACAHAPHNYALHQALIEWLRGEGPGAAEPAVRRLLEIHPADAWGRRELALLLGEQARHDEAQAELALAAALEPASSTEASVRGSVLERAGRVAEARASFREAIRRDVDNESAIARLIETSGSHAERLEDLAFVEAELTRQVTLGDGLLAFARRARGTLGTDALLETLALALEARPDLWHAWAALIGEHVERGEHDEAVALARRAVARFPLLPKLRLDQAAALRASGDRDGEREALDRALRINPGYGPAARELAQLLERDGRFEASRAVLERAAAHAPLDALNHGFLADALWHLGETDAAAERIARALRLDPAYEWAWDTLASWSADLGRPRTAANLARELTRTRGGDARAWLALARVLDGPEACDERIAALDRAAALDPRALEPHDRKAELLVEAGRFDEAEAACRPSEWGDRPPVALRGRAAWVVAARGDRVGALARIRAVLADDPDYAWGWRQRAGWAREAGTPEEYIEAAEVSARLWPDSASSQGTLGEARERQGDRAGAKAAYRRALALAPSYGFVAMNLFDLELEDEELDAAGLTLDALKGLGDIENHAYALAREVQWHVARSDLPSASGVLDRLCVAADVGSEWPYRAADRAFAEAGWTRQADEVYVSALARPDAVPMIGVVWADRRAGRWDRRQDRRLAPLLKAGGDAAHHAVAAHVRALGQARAGVRLRACLRRHRAALRGHTHSWGMVGFALMNVRRPRAAARWLADWPGRSDLRPWMLMNLVLALRALGRDAEANRAGRHALELPADSSTPSHRLWLALDDLLEGRNHEASTRLDGIDPSSLDATNLYLHCLAELLGVVATADPRSIRRVARAGRRALVALNRETAVPPEDHVAVLRASRRAARVLTRPSGRWLGPLLSLFLRLRPPLQGSD